MIKRYYGVLVLLAVGLALVSCKSGSNENTVSPIPTPAQGISVLPSPAVPRELPPAAEPPTAAPATSDPVVLQAQADLATRLKLPILQVEIASVAQIEMPPGLLGCDPKASAAQPGIILGRELTLRARGQEYTYRTDGHQLVPCQPAAFPGGREPLLVTATNPAETQAVNLAKDDLAQRTGVSKSDLEVVSAESVAWPDASLGCPRPGMMYAQMVVLGYRVVLKTGGQIYEYHTSATHATLCNPQK